MTSEEDLHISIHLDKQMASEAHIQLMMMEKIRAKDRPVHGRQHETLLEPKGRAGS